MGNIKQNIISTADNQKQQKSNIFYSSSTVFWCVFNREKKIDTSISFLNHLLCAHSFLYSLKLVEYSLIIGGIQLIVTLEFNGA